MPEVQYDNGWHMLDASLISYFPKSDGSLAGVEEITGSLARWLDSGCKLRVKIAEDGEAIVEPRAAIACG